MPSYSQMEIRKTLDQIAKMHKLNENFVSAEFTSTEKIIVRYLDKGFQIPKLSNFFDVVSLDGNTQKIKVEIEEGPKIISSIGDIRKEPPLKIHPLNGEMGGDWCSNANNMNYYGTISFYSRKIDIDVSGRICNYHCSSANAMISCNHVIARSDAGVPGEIIWTELNPKTASLQCILRLDCEADLATAQVMDPTSVQFAAIRNIGLLNNVRSPVLGESIKKFGARTGYTQGNVVSQAVLYVNGHLYHNVFKTTGGFSCPGDSGSAMVAANNDLIGILAWGDNIDCKSNPAGYFWTFDFSGYTDEDCAFKFSFEW